MGTESNRRKKLRALVRKTVGLGRAITKKDAEKIVSIGTECLPTLSTLIRDETAWNGFREDRSEISPIVAFFLVGAIGSPEGFDDLVYVIEKHYNDLPLELSDFVSSAMASCSDGREDFLFWKGTEKDTGKDVREIWLEAFALLVHLHPEKKATVVMKLRSFLDRHSLDRVTNALIVSSLLDLESAGDVPAVRALFDDGLVDESIEPLKDFEEEVKNPGQGGKIGDLFQPPISFFEPDNLDSITDSDEDDLGDGLRWAELAAEIGRKFEALFNTTRKVDPCPCGRGKKFGECCLPLINERRKINPIEDYLRTVIKGYTDDRKNGWRLSMAIDSLGIGKRILMENDMELIMDWYVHDFHPAGDGNNSIDLVIGEMGSELKDEDVDNLKKWTASAFSLYVVLSIRKGVGYMVEDTFLEPGKRVFVADTSSSIMTPRFQLLFMRLYDFGKINRIAGGVVSAPYSLKGDFIAILDDKFRDYLEENGTSPDKGGLARRKEFLRARSMEIIKGFWERIDAWREEMMNRKVLTPEGHPVKICQGEFRLNRPGDAEQKMSSSRLFIRGDDESKVFFNWIDDGGRIGKGEGLQQVDGNHKDRGLTITTQLIIPDSKNPRYRDGVTVLGNVEISNGKLLLTSVSQERYDALRSLAVEMLGENIANKISEKFTLPETGMGGGREEDDEEFGDRQVYEEEYGTEGDKEWPSEEEISEEFLGQMTMMRYYEKWLKEKMPILQNKSPMEASKDPVLKEKLVDLLREMENEQKKPPMFGMAWLRDELGIEEFEE